MDAATQVHNRFVVVMGGYNDDVHKPTDAAAVAVVVSISAGPAMCSARCGLGAVVLENQIWVVGGNQENGDPLGTVESIRFNAFGTHRDDNKTKSEKEGTDSPCTTPLTPSLSQLFSSSSSWTLQTNLCLSTARGGHSICSIGTCLVVAGGIVGGRLSSSVEIVDPQRGVVWRLPDLTVARYGCSLLSLSTQDLLVLGGSSTQDSMESLSFVALSLFGMESTIQGLEKACMSAERNTVAKALRKSVGMLIRSPLQRMIAAQRLGDDDDEAGVSDVDGTSYESNAETIVWWESSHFWSETIRLQ